MKMTTGGAPRKKLTKDEQIEMLKETCSIIEQDNVKLREQVKNLTIPVVSDCACDIDAINIYDEHGTYLGFMCPECNKFSKD